MASRKIRLASNSRYVGTPVYQLRDVLGDLIDTYAMGVWVRVKIPDRSDDIVHTVTQSEIGRLDLVANTYYGDSLLWWVIADKNGISDPITDMFAGQSLRIPQGSVVQSAIKAAVAAR